MEKLEDTKIDMWVRGIKDRVSPVVDRGDR